MREIRIVTLSNVSRRGFRSLRTGLDCLVLFLIATAMYLAVAVTMAALLQIESILVGNVLAVAFLTLLAYLVLVGRVARFPQRQIYHAFWNDHESRLALWFAAAAIFAVIVGALVVAAGCRVDRSPGCVANVSGFLLLQFTPLWSVGALLVCIGRAVFRRTAVPFLGPQPLRAIGRVRGDMATSRLTRKLPRSLARSAAATLAIALFGTASAWAYASTLPMFRSSIPSGSTQETLLAAALFTIGLVVILLLAYVVVAYIRSDALDAAPAGTRPVVLFLRPFGRRARKLEILRGPRLGIPRALRRHRRARGGGAEDRRLSHVFLGRRMATDDFDLYRRSGYDRARCRHDARNPLGARASEAGRKAGLGHRAPAAGAGRRDARAVDRNCKRDRAQASVRRRRSVRSCAGSLELRSARRSHSDSVAEA